ncbi:MAG TPA: HAMP domain-containing sensor histidine kinase [Puia sp.]|nr:HAMP domain-containing sensor histidine kinase [Puia sp.]
MSKSLQQKNTHYFLIWLPFVLLVGTLLFYVMLSMHVHHMQKKQLELKQANISNALITKPDAIAWHIFGEYDIVKGTPIPSDRLSEPRDTSIFYADNKQWVAFNICTKQYSVKGVPYQLTTYISSKEITHLIIKVFIAEAFIFVLLLGAVVIINRKSSGVLWRPFYTTMKRLKEYDINKNQSLQLAKKTGISEFDQLNQVIANLINEVNQAYSNQKQFVENASHELQTPLAIIRSKLDLLINTPHLTEETARLLGDITDANDRLSQMNKNLLLLARIDNNQFPEQTGINIAELIEKLLVYYRGYYDEDLPLIRKSVQRDIYWVANFSLIEILISNLINNAIVHNTPNGWVDIQLKNNELIIENTGYSIAGETDQLFERFKKGREQSKTTGLGLSLVKQICHLYQFDLQYTYTENIHRIRVGFEQIQAS